MRRAGVSRTAFYRQFTDIYDVVGVLLERLVEELAGHAGAWFNDPDAVGSAEVIHENALRSGRALAPRARLLRGIVDATGLDESLRQLWWDRAVQVRIDATVAAIRRDQAAGAIRPDLDAEATALALTVMGEHLALELFGRRGARADEWARIIAPIWEAVLFGSGR